MSGQEVIPFGIDVEGPLDGHRRPSLWVSSADVAAAGGRIVATVERVCKHPKATMHDGRILENVIAVHFIGDTKPMVLEADGNWVRLLLGLGPDATAWRGRRVVLFNERTRHPSGVWCWGARCRAARRDET